MNDIKEAYETIMNFNKLLQNVVDNQERMANKLKDVSARLNDMEIKIQTLMGDYLSRKDHLEHQ